MGWCGRWAAFCELERHSRSAPPVRAALGDAEADLDDERLFGILYDRMDTTPRDCD